MQRPGLHTILITGVMFFPVMAATQGLPDPTRPASYTGRLQNTSDLPQELVNWDVRAIKRSGDKRNAIVNGKLVNIGDEIDSATIIDITENSVVLDYGRKELVLRLIPGDIKVRRTADIHGTD